MIEKVRRNRFAERLKTLRKAAGMNQVSLASRLGVTQVTVCLYEAGRREPDLDDLMAIAEKLETTPNDLLGFPGGNLSTAVDKLPPAAHNGVSGPLKIGDGSVVIGGVNAGTITVGAAPKRRRPRQKSLLKKNGSPAPGDD